MLFASFEFIFGLLPVSVLGYFLLARLSARAAIWWLVGVSLFFYAWWRPENLPLFLSSIVVNYFFACGLRAAKDQGWRRALFIAAIVCDLGLLALFKYGNFGVENINRVCGSAIALPDIVLPLGISFFTFTQITYLADTYRGHGRAIRFLFTRCL